jgi:hypothetical protein
LFRQSPRKRKHAKGGERALDAQNQERGACNGPLLDGESPRLAGGGAAWQAE